MSESAPLLRFEDLTVRRSGASRADIENFSMALAPGGTLTLLGESGCGKDAVLRVLLRTTERGEDIRGAIVFRMNPPQLAVARAPTDLRIVFLPGPHAGLLNPNASVLSQLSLIVARKLRQPKASARAEIALALEKLPGAPPVSALDHLPSLVAPEVLGAGLLAAAMAQTPDLVIADDPLGELSPAHAQVLATALKAEQKRLGFALLYSAARADAATLLDGDMIVLRSGKIVEEGPVSRLATEQSHAYTQTLFRAKTMDARHQTSERGVSRAEPVLRAQSVQLLARGKTTAKDSLNFELRRGASLALVGEIGSGRRSLTRALLGLEPVAAGRVVFDQVDIGVLNSGMMARLRRRVAFITGDDDALDPRMTIFDTVAEPLRAHLDMPRDLVAHNRDAALKRVGLAALPGHRPVAALSPFDRRRLQIARAIVVAPLLAVIDEPLRGLDGFAQSVVRDLLRTFRANEGPAFLVITSDFGLARAFCEDAFVFKDGRIVERGPISMMMRLPQDPHTRKLLEAVGAIARLQQPAPADPEPVAVPILQTPPDLEAKPPLTVLDAASGSVDLASSPEPPAEIPPED